MLGRGERLSIATRWVVVVVPLIAASCSLFVDTDGLSGAPQPDMDASPDAGADALGSDGGSADASPANPCTAPSVVFCERFDTPNALSPYTTITDPTTSVELDDTLSFSPPRSARFTISPSTNDMSPDAVLTIQSPSSLARFAVEARVNIEYGEPQEAARLVNVVVNGMTLSLDPSGRVRQGNSTATNLAEVPSGQWLPVRFEVRTDASPPTAVVSVGDATTSAVTLTGGWAPGKVTVRLGISEANSPTRGWLVRWDDLVIRQL